MIMNDFQKQIWQDNYKAPTDNTIQDTFKRVALTVAAVEQDKQTRRILYQKFYQFMSQWKFIPGGRIIANAGVKERPKATLYNCYVYHPYDFGIRDIDSMQGIFQTLKKSAKILASEGGLGINATFIRPNGSLIEGTGATTPGVLKFLELWDKASQVITMGATVKGKDSQKAKKKIRKGAQLCALDFSHPEIKQFITAKQQSNRLTKFNLSVLIPDRFMRAVQNDQMWQLQFPDTRYVRYKQEWDGDLEQWIIEGKPTIVYQELPARQLWDLIMFSTYNRNQPGVLFYDTINDYHPVNYAQKILTTNPCGEIPQSSNICNLSHINLTRFYNKQDNSFDFEQFSQVVQFGVFFLDNVCQIGNVPLSEYDQKIQDYRKIGLGVMGLGSLLMMMGLKFGSYEAIELTKKIFKTKAQIELLTSAMIGKFKGSFKKFDSKEYFNSKWWLELDIDYVVKRNIQNANAMRNSVHSTVAPTGNCLVSDTRVRTNKGVLTLQQIFRMNRILLDQNINTWYISINDELMVQTLDGYKKIIRLYNNQHSQELYRIETQNGKTIEGTGDHKILVRQNDSTSWKKLKEFTQDDHILIRQNKNVKQENLKQQKIISITRTSNNTYDIQIQQDHHYILQNGIISHNSSLFSGQVSNGIEPVFMKQYTRWVVVTDGQKQQIKLSLQEQQKDPRIPNPQLGQWFETQVFELSKRGDQQILRGQIDGKIYQIDKNRGLVKSMQIRDYGWNYILQNQLSDEGVVQIDELTVQQHLNMLAASGKYINQNQSKTINIPQDYSYQDFKNVYMQAWKRKIKGITTYRAGTMTAVLQKKQTDQDYQSELQRLYKQNQDGVIFSDVKIPDTSYALQYKVKDKNKKKWYFTMCFADKDYTIPFALFIRTNNRQSTQVTDSLIKSMQNLLLSAGIKQQLIEVQRQKYAGQTNVDKIGRAIGMALRHNVPLVDIVDTLQTQADGLSTLLYHIKRILSQYIKDGTKVQDKTCQQCGMDTLVYQGGCQTCSNCGNSRCG